MKKKLFTIALALCMVFTMIPGGVFQIETAWADTVTGSGTSQLVEKLYIGGKELSTDKGLYYHNATENTEAKVDNNESEANAILDPESGTLTLHNLNVNASEEGICWGEENNYDYRNLVIQINGNNSINASSTGIAGRYGDGEAGPSLTIKGEGTLSITSGANGIWVWKDITIEENPTISITGVNGIGNNFGQTSVGSITINGGNLTISADEKAMGVKPIYAENYTIIASKNKDGSYPEEYYIGDYISDYKYLKFTQKHTHCICGTAHEDENGDIGDHTSKRTITFDAWDKTDSLPQAAGRYYLTDDVVLGSTWNLWGISDEVILCLNGHSISTKADGYYQYNRLIDVRSSNLTLTDCRGTGKVINNGKVSNIEGIDISYLNTDTNASTFNMYKISVEGFTNGGVNLGNSAGKFNMYSGVIQKNNSEFNGGGVTVGSKFPGYGFYMYGGTITNNTTTNGDGGGVLAYAPFTIGGKVTITENCKDTDTGRVASNVYFAYSSNIAISNTASTESTIGVTTRQTLTEGSDAVMIAKGAEGSGILSTALADFKNCFISDVDSSRIRPVIENDAIKFKYFAKTPQAGFEYSDKTVDKTYGDTAFTNETLSINGLAEEPQITYTSSNENIAAINRKTGEVTIKRAGTAVITATAEETENYAEATASYTINIAKLEIDAPTADTTKYVYDGTEKTYTFTDMNDRWYYTITGNDTPRINANEDGYTITVSLDEPENTVWSDTKDTADKTYKFVIARKAIKAPAADTTVFTYTGEAQTYNIAPSEGGEYTVTGNTQTDAGTYTVKVTPGANYKWNDGTSGDKTYQFVIQKQEIAEPELIKSTFVYSGETITPEFKEEPNKFTLVGATSAKDAYVGGFYMITATPKANYKLSDDREFVNLLWNITKADLTIQPKDISIQEGDELPTNFEVDYNKLKGSDTAETAVTGTMQFELVKDEAGTALSDSKTAGEYIIRVKNAEEITSKNYNLKFETAKLTITKKPSSGGGGSSTPRTDVTTTGSTDSKVTSSPTQVKNETKTDANGNNVTTATVTVSSANQREILKQAKANKSGEIIIKVSQNEVKDGAKLELSLEKSFIESILNDTDAKLTVQTPSGEKTFTQDELKNLAAEATGSTVTLDPTSAGTTEPTNPSADKNAKLVKGVGNTTIVLKSKLTKDGKVLLTWTKSKGYKVDKFEFYRSVKKNSGYGTKAFFTTKDGSWSKYLNTKNLKAGKTYYYKVRGVRVIDGQKYYTQWSNKAWRTVK